MCNVKRLLFYIKAYENYIILILCDRRHVGVNQSKSKHFTIEIQCQCQISPKPFIDGVYRTSFNTSNTFLCVCTRLQMIIPPRINYFI